MLIQTLQQILLRDLLKLRQEITLYKKEENIWAVVPNISNPAGNLVLHLVGNLNTYIGATLGNTGYVRHRDLEFSLKNISRTELLDKIDGTSKMISDVMDTLDDSILPKNYPLIVLEKEMTTEFFLVHLTAHFSYHLGQINYHRRLLDKE
ncbi:DinB family protein [Chryseotalea sanaruensis]|uniref:DinB family protein n=1 Tax=Chryseotalea sanaruensis TaxID=2482724 RepID=A0A401U9M7_9BACT|nr:DUF1572 family protein [Chryseotalea sanaruensis]GCC51618.1 DinB family protein [Chryseotalea sanaruensis]